MSLWTPTSRELNESNLARFKDLVASTIQKPLRDYEELHAWSVNQFQDFWELWLRESGIRFNGATQPVYVPSASGTFFGGDWFPNVRLNFAETMLARLPKEAIVGLDELGRRRSFSAVEVRQQVRGLQTYLRAQGVKQGDVVAAVLPNIPETIIAMLATASLGAVWSSCSPDFGVQGILDRLTQVKPKVLFVADGYSYGGKRIPLDEKNQAVLAQLPSVQATVTIDFMGRGGDYGAKAYGDNAPVEFTATGFRAPLYILFSSGTTGQPKCIIHSAGGVLLQLTKELALHTNLKPNEKLLYYTTCGWMMWNWMVSALAVGSTVVCYDGSPSYPEPDSIWSIVDREGVDVFGTSAKFLSSNRSQGLRPSEKFHFSKLRAVLSTGSPLLPEDFDYFYSHVSPDHRLPIASVSGGTDIVSCFMLGCPIKPVERGEIQCRGLGLKVQALNDQGQPVFDERGELVCATPFPSMPIGFIDDPQNAKYSKAYFERFPNVWHHGDYITVHKETGGIIVHGRSDATLNPGGVRLGTAEIYRQVETHPAVQDSIVVGQRWEGDERVVLFVKLKDVSHTLDAALIKELRDRIRQGASPRHVPAKIIQVADIPYTVSGKKVELAVKAIIHGETPKNIEALANPKSLELYKGLAALTEA